MSNVNQNKKYHFIYKTTHIESGKYYIGMHSTSNLKDGYLGSGKRLRYSINKYGAENFKCEILEFLPDKLLLAAREKEIVNDNLLKDKKCLNLKPGGFGGGKIWNAKHGKKFSAAGKKSFNEKLKDKDFKDKLHNTHSESNKSKPRGWNKDKSKRCNWVGRTHSDETIQLMKSSKAGQGSGKSNSQFGSFWITNGIENKKVRTNSDIPKGWYKGRMG